eukprot:scaffold243897_cov44-Prasinocladus_malaysianus.AAC.1
MLRTAAVQLLGGLLKLASSMIMSKLNRRFSSTCGIRLMGKWICAAHIQPEPSAHIALAARNELDKTAHTKRKWVKLPSSWRFWPSPAAGGARGR